MLKQLNQCRGVLGALLLLLAWVTDAVAQRDVTSTRMFPPAAQFPSSGVSKTVPNGPRFSLDKDLADQLLPFEEVYQIALAHTTALRIENTTVDMKAGQAAYAKISILENIAGSVNYSRGNSLLVATGTGTTNIAESNSSTNFYRTGVGMSLSLGDIVGRKYKIQQNRLEHQLAIDQLEIAKLRFKRELSRAYQGLITSQRVLQVKLRDEQAALIVLRLAEVNMQQNKISPADYTQVSNLYSTAQLATEQVRSEYMINFRDFEILVGVPMIQLLTSK